MSEKTDVLAAQIRGIADVLVSVPAALKRRAVADGIRDLADQLAALEPQHSDDAAIDVFATAMKAKMARKRAEGRGGWDDPEDCPADFLRKGLVKHVSKGDPVDVGNFAMMLFNRREPTGNMIGALIVAADDYRRTMELFANEVRRDKPYPWEGQEPARDQLDFALARIGEAQP